MYFLRDHEEGEDLIAPPRRRTPRQGGEVSIFQVNNQINQIAREFVCPAASLSSQSNTSLRLRGRSRTSSAAGDSLAVNGNFTKNALLNEIKPKLRSTKYNMRLLSSSHRNIKKFNKPKKSTRPPVNCFHNTIVIAPFHTLKKCFQSKLVDLYSTEKVKNMTHKMRMAKKQNMSFEYDVLELEKVNAKVKTEKGKKAAPKKQKEKSPSYCQCDRDPKEKPVREVFNLHEPPSFSKAGGKRRRLNSSVFTPTILKAELEPTTISFNLAEPLPKSGVSEGRSNDSWECLSNSPSQGGEHLEGMIAISTTSFDSCLEQFDKETCSFFEPKNYSQRRTVREERVDAEYVSRPTNEAGHFIINDGMMSSDGNIADFMDREPQSQEISMEPGKHLKPLKRQSKSKIKRPEMETTEYYLRSKSQSKEKIFPEQMNIENRGSTIHCFCAKRSVQIEVATQVENSLNQEPESVVPLLEEEQLPNDIPAQTETEPTESTDTPETEKKDEEETIEPILLEDPNKPIEIELLPQEKPDIIVPSKKTSEPQESDFIFGTGSMASRLGESCEFTFGLNWVFPDDETPKHGDRYFQ